MAPPPARGDRIAAVAELMFNDFLGVCFDQIFNQAAKFRYMFGGKATTPLVIRTMIGAGRSAARSTRRASITSSPRSRLEGRGAVQRLRRQGPADPGDPRRRPGRVLRAQADVRPPHRGAGRGYTIPFGEANVVRDGEHVTIVALARMVHYAGDAAEKLAAEGIECEIIDPRTTSPLDADTILESVERTGRLVVVDEAPPRCGMAVDIAALVAGQAFGALKAPIRQVTAPHTPVPFSPSLEKLYIPSPSASPPRCARSTVTDAEPCR